MNAAAGALRDLWRWLRDWHRRYLGDVGYISRKFHSLVVHFRHGSQIQMRRALARRCAPSPLVARIAEALEKHGYFQTSVEELGGNAAIVDYCRQLAHPVASFSLDEVAAARSGKSKAYWLELYPGESLGPNPIAEFVTLPLLLQVAARYLGEVPVLHHISLFFTPPGTAHLMLGSQGWHMDNDQNRQMKIFMLGIPADGEAGPSRFLPSEFSPPGAYRNYPGYFTDEQLVDFGLPSEKILEFKGEAGAVLLLDTSRVYHCGSRTLGKPRLQMIATYQPLMSNLPYADFRSTRDPAIVNPATNAEILRFFETRAGSIDV